VNNQDSEGCAMATMVLGIALLAFVGGIYIGSRLTRAYWRDETVNHGAAEYNQTTGAWQWKEPSK
jgi:hypothetical protein